MLKVAFYTLGCKVNTYETEAVRESFEKKGYEVVDFEGYSDIYIINSCMVTNSGERKSKQIIRRPLKYNEEAIIIVMGCLSQLKAKMMLEIPGVKIVLGTKNRSKILEYLNEYLVHKKQLNYSEDLVMDETFENLELTDFKSHKRAFVKIQDGCNNFCTFCIIPYTRGRIRSKDSELVIEEVKKLVEHGHIEIVLTGIHTGGYAEDLTYYSFANLLSDLEKIEGLERIRISSIEITELNDDVLQVISKSKKIVNHLHVPLQSGSNRILEKMNRKYDKEKFISHIENIRKQFKQLAITTDVIVGFPGETEDDFQEAYDFINKVGFQELHVFPYSKRQGTPADKMPDQIDGNVKKERVKRLIKLSDELKEKYFTSVLNQERTIIFEQVKQGYLFGHSEDYLPVLVSGDERWIGKAVKVKIIDIDFPNVIGKMI